jgi:hypothetical protein
MLQSVFKGLMEQNRKIVPYIRSPLFSFCMKPTFLIIGAQKAGTTSLFRYLLQHPDILAPVVKKELHFFDLNFYRGSKWYCSHFPLQKYRKITGEKSPYYFYHPLVPKRSFEFNHKLKLIALLRDPVKRAYSHYNHEIENKREKRTFRQAINQEIKKVDIDHIRLSRSEISYSANHHRYSYYARGCYVEQLDLWMQFFPRDQFYFETSERFFRDPQEVCSEIFDFLKLKPFTPSTAIRHNSGKYDPIIESDKYWLAKMYKECNRKLAKAYMVDINDWA